MQIYFFEFVYKSKERKENGRKLKWGERGREKRDCFLGRRQSPRSSGAPSQLRRHKQQILNT